MTILEHPVRGRSEYGIIPGDFDPLAEFAGMWDVRLAEHYSQWLNEMFGKWECVQGRLVVAPYEASSNSWGEHKLSRLISDAAEKAGLYVYGCLNLVLAPDTWLQPDVSVLKKVPRSPETRKRVPFDHFIMPVEFVSPSSRRRDRIDKPALLAAAGMPYYMLVEIDPVQRSVTVEQRKLADGGWVTIAQASTGQMMKIVEPFEAEFAVDQLLEPQD